MKAIKLILAGALVATTVLMAVSCGKTCDICGETSTEGKSNGDQFICQECLDNPLDAAAKMLEKGLEGLGD